MNDSPDAWAAAEFGDAQLGDQRRTRRLVAMAATLAAHPAGRITRAFTKGAEREAAYRLVESAGFSANAIAAAAHAAAAQRAASHERVVVPIDGVAFTVAYQGKGFGPVSNKSHGNGAHAMTALALTPKGIPLGVLSHVWWTRTTTAAPKYTTDKRPIEQRESGHWLTALTHATSALRQHAPATKPWFQLDRGGDCSDVLLHALKLGVDVTARACYDRVVTGGKLWGKAAAGTCLGTYSLRVTKPGARPRLTAIAVRVREVELHLRPGPMGRGPVQLKTMRVVEARERRGGKNRVLWRLLTTLPVTTFAEARAVIAAYTQRWRIEEFHLAWKSGACGIEFSWLRQREHFFKWATLLSAVAARLERIRLLSRSEPERSALDEFTRDEIDAAIALRKPKGVELGATPTLGEVTRWIADIGGYTGKSSGGPPGIRVITRGFDRVEAAAVAVASLRKDPRSRG
jgi:Transposase DNA-binding/Transposase Tn5 dimerisation domain